MISKSKIAIFNSDLEKLSQSDGGDIIEQPNRYIIDSWMIQDHLVMISGPELTWDNSGFKLYEQDGETLVKDCSKYTKRYDIYSKDKNTVYLTDLDDFTEPDPSTVEWEEFVNDSPSLDKLSSDIQYLSMMSGVEL